MTDQPTSPWAALPADFGLTKADNQQQSDQKDAQDTPPPKGDDPVTDDSQTKGREEGGDQEQVQDEGQDQYTPEELEQFGPYAQGMMELVSSGVLDPLDEELSADSEGFAALVSRTVDSRANAAYQNLMASLPETVQDLVEVGLQGGDPKHYFESYRQKDFASMDLTDKAAGEALQVEVLQEYLSRQGYDQTKIAAKIKNLRDAELLKQEALDAQEILVRDDAKREQEYKESLKRQKAEEERNRFEFAKMLNDSVESLKDVASIPVSDVDRKALKAYVTQVDKTGMTQFARELNGNPENLVKAAFLMMKKFNGKPAVDRGSSQALLKFRKVLSNAGTPTTPSKTNQQPDVPKFKPLM